MSAGRLAERVEHNRVDLTLAVDAVLEVRDARPRIERRVAKRREPLVDLLTELARERQPLFARRSPEEQFVQAVEPP